MGNRCSCWMIPRHGQRNGMNLFVFPFTFSHPLSPTTMGWQEHNLQTYPHLSFCSMLCFKGKASTIQKMKHSKNLSSIHNSKTFRGIYFSKAFLHYFCCSRLATLEEFEDKEVEPHGKHTAFFSKGQFHPLGTRHCSLEVMSWYVMDYYRHGDLFQTVVGQLEKNSRFVGCAMLGRTFFPVVQCQLDLGWRCAMQAPFFKIPLALECSHAVSGMLWGKGSGNSSFAGRVGFTWFYSFTCNF